MMLLKWILAFNLSIALSPLAQAQVDTPDPKPAQCANNERPVWITLKESFRYYPERRNGIHQFFLISGCESPVSESVSRLTGQVYVGKESDADYAAFVPRPLADTVQSRSFQGTYQDVKLIAHGSAVGIRSDDGKVTVEGNFYSNRDISFTVDGAKTPATLVK